jgi:hypothetical protein
MTNLVYAGMHVIFKIHDICKGTSFNEDSTQTTLEMHSEVWNVQRGRHEHHVEQRLIMAIAHQG